MRYLFLSLFIVCVSFTAQSKVKAIHHPHEVHLASLHSHLFLQDSLVHHDTIIHRKHKLIAALLAFPLGIFGLHRMYLGTATQVPLLYIATLGGVFGILPFVDFVLIIMNKDINAYYAHNPHVFMWSKKDKPTQP